MDDYTHEHPEGIDIAIKVIDEHLKYVHGIEYHETFGGISLNGILDAHVESHVKATMDAIEESAKEAHAENPEVSEDDAYHDIAQSLMTMCLPAVASEVARRTGVPQLNVRTDDEEETWLSSC